MGLLDQTAILRVAEERVDQPQKRLPGREMGKDATGVPRDQDGEELCYFES